MIKFCLCHLLYMGRQYHYLELELQADSAVGTIGERFGSLCTPRIVLVPLLLAKN